MSTAAAIAIDTGNMSSPIHAFREDSKQQTAPTVFIVEEDVCTRKSLERLIHSQGWRPEACESAREFLALPRAIGPNVLILAFSSSSSNGLEIQKRLAREYLETPIIVVADYEDVPTAVQAIKAGAVDFLLTPVTNDQLLIAIRQSLGRSRAILDRSKEMHDVRSRYASLSPREQQVMALVASGRLNKQVGGELGISEITVKAHRGQVMRKMKATCFVHLVNMAMKLRISTTRPGVFYP